LNVAESLSFWSKHSEFNVAESLSFWSERSVISQCSPKPKGFGYSFKLL
jgi:hypothetical protein